MRIATFGVGIAALLVLATAGSAAATNPMAETSGVPKRDAANTRTATPLEMPAPSQVEERPAVVDDDDLAETRGRQTIVVSDQTLESLVGQNVINGDYRAGDITISQNALSQFTGLGNFVINTGAQASLQAGLSVSLNISGDPN